MLESRVRPDGHKDLENATIYIGCTKKFVSKHNDTYIKNLSGDMITLKAINIHPYKKGEYKPPLDEVSGTIGGTAFKDVIEVKKGAKIILIHNLDTSDCLTNGQLGVLVDVILRKNGTVDKLVVKFNNKNVGRKSILNNKSLLQKFPSGCVILERVQIQYSLRKKGNSTGATATLYQFPIWLAHSITCHKIQGQSIPSPQVVVVDIESVFRSGGPLAYVMLSRVQNINQLYILNKLNPNKIVCDDDGLAESERIRKISWNENPTPWIKQGSNSVKIASMNCCRLESHIQFMRNDDRLLQADVIQVKIGFLASYKIDVLVFRIPIINVNYISNSCIV